MATLSQRWNGLDLVTEFATLTGDTSTAPKARILTYLNDVQEDICSKHDWPFMLVKGKKVLTASTEVQDLSLGSPGAPTLAIAAGGSLTADTNYQVRVTYYESVADVESIAGTESAVATPTGASLKINLTAIPTSADPLVTARKIYLQIMLKICAFFG